jgi:tetratricopeptide (TPR) repeat protein
MGKDTAVGDLIESRMKSLTTNAWLDFDTLTSVTENSPIYHESDRTGIFYAESWALAHMLYLSPEYKDNFGKFVTALHGGKSTAEAMQIAWNKTPNEVFQNLSAYFSRKKLFGVVFETRIDAREDNYTVGMVPDFDARLALADLLAASGKRDEALADYAKLEAEHGDRADLNRSAGFLALADRDFAKARQYFTRAFEANESDALMCFDLAVLDREAKMPPAKIIPILERAIATRPDYTDAKVELGLMRIDARDPAGAIATLTGIPKINAQTAPRVYCGLAYAHMQTGELDKARQDLGTCSKYAKEGLDAQRAERILKMVEARSDPAAAVRPGETLQRVSGTALGVQCAAEGSRLQIAVGDKVVAFDLPAPAAVEMPATPAAAIKIQCGALPRVPIGVEFAPPRSVMETSAGVVRRLDY